MISFLFFLFSVVAIASAIMMVVHRNAVYSALFLILTLFALAGHFVLLNAPFIAAVHIIVYAGAIMVLFLFVVMLLDLKADERKSGSQGFAKIFGGIVTGILILELGIMIKKGSESLPAASANMQVGSTNAVGHLMFTQYLFPFEVASVLLLSAIIGSVILAKRKLK
ncbi:NADH-quinone oxidoreductase subunit J [bacterium]|nr:NADH-quinone oxidoreductase subunit J [bacterium]